MFCVIVVYEGALLLHIERIQLQLPFPHILLQLALEKVFQCMLHKYLVKNMSRNNYDFVYSFTFTLIHALNYSNVQLS